MKVFYSNHRKSSLLINRPLFIKLVSETVELSGIKASGTMSIVFNFVSEKEICRMNSEYMNHEGITDVISFPYITDEDIDTGAGIFAEIFICVKKAETEAAARNIPFAEELALYVIHGILRVAGYDDLEIAPRKKMRQAEAKCMKHLKKHLDILSVFKFKNT